MNGQARKAFMPPLLLALLGVALVLLLLYVGLQRDLRRADRVDDAIAHSIEVREALGDVAALHVEVESGMRAYAMTGDRRLLAPYTQGMSRLKPVADRLARREANSHAGTGYAALIASASEDHAAFGRQIVALIADGRVAEARAQIAADGGTAAIDRLRSLVAGLQSEEQAQMQRHRAEAADIRAGIDDTLRLTLLALAVLLAGGGFAGKQIISSQASRIESDSNLFHAVIDPIILLSDRGIIQSSNSAAQRTFGYSEHELTGASVAVLLAEWPAEERLALGLQTLVKGNRHTGAVRDYLFRRRNGTRFRGNVSVSIAQAGDVTTLAAIIRPHLGLEQLMHSEGADNARSRSTRTSSGIDLLDSLRARMHMSELQDRQDRRGDGDS